MSNTPNIRFKGFNKLWEQRKLIDVCDYVDYRGKTPTKTETGIFLVTAKNVKDGYIDYESSKEYISEDDYKEVMHRGKPLIGDVLITTEAPCGNVAQVNRENIALAQRIIKYRGHSNVIDNTYLKHYLLSPEFQGVLNAKSSGGTVKGIKGSILHQQIIQYPLYEEQVKIGQCLDKLDNLITLQQRKCDETSELKKYMLQKMFPRNGEYFPELRFSGYTEPWEQRKLGDVTETIKNGYSYKPDGSREHRYKVTRIESISSGIINIEKLGSCEEVNDTYKLEDGDILFSHINSLPYIANVALYTSDLGEIYHGMNLLNIRARNSEIYSHFLLHLLKRDNSREWFRNVAKPAVNQCSIATTDVAKFGFYMPNLLEQIKIADALDNIDKIIALHQRKCDELKDIKKYMLQNMFPKKG